MRAVDIIEKTRDGQPLTGEEIGFFVEEFTSGSIPDYQVAAWAMAVYFRGMTDEETIALTLAMARSGQMLDLHDVAPFIVDKHSTGGVGDKTTLSVAPIVASLGVRVGKMSGRCLSFSGGTLDKLESIPGWQSNLSLDEFKQQLVKVGLVIAGQTADMAPADGRLYALRDVTGTVPSLALVASSIMSKKLAGGADAIVLDVKSGRGAFMDTEDEALRLAQLMLRIGRRLDRRMAVVISDMNQPLGNAVGNALEVVEAIETLKGAGPMDFREHTIVISAEMLLLAGHAKDERDAREMATGALDSGSALVKFREYVEAQGGDGQVVDDQQRLPSARFVCQVLCPQSGYVAAVDAREIGLAVVEMGGGRTRKGDVIDHAAGVVLHAKIGDRVEKEDPLADVHVNDWARLEPALSRVSNAYTFQDQPTKSSHYILRILR